MQNKLSLNSNDNSLFVTGQCNNRCLMCCQPPTKKDDIDILFKKNLKIMEEAPHDLSNIAITGGEPTLLGDKLFYLIQLIREKFPETLIHILSNGRKFADLKYVKALQEVSGEMVSLGIPLHSDYYKCHDEIAQSPGAFNETMLGLYNLAAYDMPIELRVIVNKLNYKRLPQLSDYVYKMLPFVECVSIIGMEYHGYAIKNSRNIWIEPIEYSNYLSEMTINLATWGVNVSLFNFPLCLIPEKLYPFARKSISDWKTCYLPTCDECLLKEECCGLFSTSIIPYKGIMPIVERTVAS